MIFGGHVSAAGGLLPAIDRADAIGARTLQVHTQSPRAWKANDYTPELLAEFARRIRVHPRISSVVCHASYLINLGTADPPLRRRSIDCLATNLQVATSIGAIGLVVHLGSHLGEGMDLACPRTATGIRAALDLASDRLGGNACRLLVENTAGAGGTIGRDFDELARIFECLGFDDRLGLCLDTQHLFASGTAFSTLEDADGAVRGLDAAVGLDRLACIHLNDSKVPFGSMRDRHENLGAGLIGRRGLGSLIGHPWLQGLPAVLEVPGIDRQGPAAEDLRSARAIHAAGLRRWKRSGYPGYSAASARASERDG
jgi:deoxyribonuclease-4